MTCRMTERWFKTDVLEETEQSQRGANFEIPLQFLKDHVIRNS